MKLKIDVQTVALVVAAALAALGLVFWANIGIAGNLFVLAVVIAVAPWLVTSYIEMSRLAAIEDQLPTFMLDLAESQKAGLTLPAALRAAAKTDYGRLTAEIKQISDQISWGVPLQEAMSRFGHRMRHSDMIRRVVRIVNEAYSSGGDITRTMEATAADIIAIKEAERGRRAIMAQHVGVMYAIYFIFIGIIVGLCKTLIPMLQLNIATVAVGGIMTFQDPCIVCAGPAAPIFCVSCGVYKTMCAMFGLGSGAPCYYRALFMLMAIIQGIFSGLVAGQIGEGRVIAGLKHSVIMTATGFGTLVILLQLGVI